MSLSETSSSGPPLILPETGLQPARCFAIIDVGSHLKFFNKQPVMNEKTGKQVQSNEILIYWELPKFMNAAKDGTSFPARIKSQYTYSASSKAKFPDVLKAWGPMKVRPEKISGDILKKFVGHLCMINVEHSKDGKYANVGSSGRGINPWMKEIAVPKEYNEKIYFNMDNFTWESFFKLPSYAQKMIRKSIEFPNIIARMPEPIKADEGAEFTQLDEMDAGGITTGEAGQSDLF